MHSSAVRTDVPVDGDRKKTRNTLLIVFFTVFLDLVGFGIIIPIQPFFAETLGASPSVITLLGASFSLMQFVFAPFWGRLSDKVGRRPVMLVSIAVSALGYFLFGFANTLIALFLARMLSGFGTANIGTAQAIIADATTPETRAKGMGIIGAAFGLGFIFGPALGGFLGQYGLQFPAYGAAGLAALNLIFAFFFLPETRVAGAPVEGGHHRAFSWASIKHTARHADVAKLFCLFFIYTISFSMMEQTLGLFIGATWLNDTGLTHAKHAAKLTAYVLTVVGVTATIIQGGLIGRLVAKFGERRLLAVGTFLLGIGFLAIPFVGMTGIFGLMLATSALIAAGSGLTTPSISSLLSRSVTANEQGSAMGQGQSVSALGRVMGPAVAGTLFQMYRGVPFWAGAALMFVCTIVTITLKPLPLKSAR